MMRAISKLVRGVMILGALALVAPSPAQAGFWDWLTHKNTKPTCGPQGCGAPPAYACGTYPAPAPVPYYTPPATRVGYAPIGYANYLPQVAPAPYAAYYGPTYANVVQYPPGYAGYTPAYPTTANYAPAYPTAVNYAPSYAAQATYAAPAEVAQPVTAFYAPAMTPGCATCPQQTRYVPQPYYRSTTNQVPVTAYRPVTSYDPATGQPVVVMKPCLAYECQMQQVRTPFTYAAPVAGCTGANCPQANCPPTYATAPAVVSAAPITTTPIPNTYTQPPGTMIIPGGVRPSIPSGSLAPTADPANQVPSLSPEGVRSGANTPAPQAWPAGNEATAPQLYSKPASLPANEPKLQPVPDPEAPRSNAAPQLIDPRDKLTLTDPLKQYKVATVVYPDAPAAKPTPGNVQHIPSLERADDSGWSSAK